MTNENSELHEYARIAYASYSKAAGGTTFDNKPLPQFKELGERQQTGWGEAARAIIFRLRPPITEVRT